MHEKLQAVLLDMMSGFIGYFPKLFAGIVLLCLGWFLAWFTKRLVIHISGILKLDHFLAPSRWRAAFERADVRYGFYNFLGNIFFFVIFLIFLDFSLIAWDLKILSDILGKVILLFPRLLVATVIFGIGWLIARLTGGALSKTLSSENVPYASSIAHYARIMLIVLFSAMSMAVLDIAREVVLIGFTIIFIMLGGIAMIMSTRGGKVIPDISKASKEYEGVSEDGPEK